MGSIRAITILVVVACLFGIAHLLGAAGTGPDLFRVIQQLQQRISVLEMEVGSMQDKRVDEDDIPPTVLQEVEKAFERHLTIPPDSLVEEYLAPGIDSREHSSTSLQWKASREQICLWAFKSPPDRELDLEDFDPANSNLFLVRHDLGNNFSVLTYTSLIATNADKWVAIGEGYVPGYLGTTSNSGVLRTSVGIDYAQDVNNVILSHTDFGSPSDVSGSGATVVNSMTFDPASLGHVTAVGTTTLDMGDFISGTNDYDIAYWINGAWAIFPADGSLYQQLTIKSGGGFKWDWTRAH